MLKVAEISSQTRRIPVRLSIKELTKIYDRLVGKTDLTGAEGELLKFYSTWGKSVVYEVDSGYIRIEPYPHLGAATVHGVFLGNPFKDSKNIADVLNCYLEGHPDISRIECHVPKRFRGVAKLVAEIAQSSAYHDSKWIFYYGG
jgi:hypothetical protein